MKIFVHEFVHKNIKNVTLMHIMQQIALYALSILGATRRAA